MNSPPTIGSHEFVLRRVHKNHYDCTQPFAVQTAAFRPSPADMSGLSVFRETLTTPEEIVAAGRALGEYCVVRLSVQALNDLRLTVVPDEQPTGPRGHALIPELGLIAYQKNKLQCKAVLVALARMASQSVVFPLPS